jgi:integrase
LTAKNFAEAPPLPLARAEVSHQAHVGAFTGLRDAEIKRLDWSEVDLARRHIEVTAAKAISNQKSPFCIRSSHRRCVRWRLVGTFYGRVGMTYDTCLQGNKIRELTSSINSSETATYNICR